MKIPAPKTIKVGGHTFSITLDPILRQNHTDRGFINFNTGEICLDSKHPARTQAFIHEILHAVNRVYFNEEWTEEKVDRLAEALYQVMVDADLELEWEDASRE